MRTGLIRGRLSSESGEWKRIPLSSLYSVKYGKANPGRPGNVPVVGSSGVYAWTENPLILHPSVVIGRKGNAGQAWLVEVPSYPSDTTFYLEPHDPAHTDIRFTYFALRYFQISASEDVIPSLQRHELENLILPFPPFPEQRAIAAVLSKIQAAVEVLDKIVATLKELKAATMVKLFREGLRGELLKQTEIGEVPESWGVVFLSSLLKEPLRNGHSASVSTDGNGVRTLTLTAVTQRDFSLANTKITNADPSRVQDLWLNDGDIFVERANTAEMVGLAALYRGPVNFAIFPDLLIRVRVQPEIILPDVLAEWLLLPWCRTYFQKHCRGAATSMPKIDQRTVENVLVALPPVEEQQMITHTIQTLDSRTSGAALRSGVLKSLFSSMLHLLMTGQVRVNNLKAEEAGN